MANEYKKEAKILDKEDLINKFFNLGGNSQTESIEEIQEKLKEYQKLNGSDKQISDILLLIKMSKLEAKFDDFEESCEIVAPIIERATTQEELDLFDIRIVTAVVGHTKNYKQSWLIGEKLLRDLEKYKDHPKYSRIKMAINSNVGSRSKRSKYHDNVSDYEELKKQFLIHIENAINLCKKENFKDFNGINTVRKGLFLGDFDLVEKGLKFIEENGNGASYKMAVTEINEYKAFIRFPVTVPQLKSIIGKNIKIHRKASRIRCEELADMLGIENSTLRHIERGAKNISLSILFKLSGFLRISIDTLFHDKSKELPLLDNNALELNEINTMILQFDPKELSSLKVVIRQILHLKKMKDTGDA